MLAVANRIRKGEEIEEVKKTGKLYQSDNFAVIAKRRKTPDRVRFAFIISTKTSKLAVHRNRLKRAFNESCRLNTAHLPDDMDFVFLVKKSIARKTAEDIMREVNVFFKNRKYFKNFKN